MNKLQKLISELEDEKSSAELFINTYKRKSYEKGRLRGVSQTLDLLIQKLTLLLNAEAETNGEKDCKNDGNAV